MATPSRMLHRLLYLVAAATLCLIVLDVFLSQKSSLIRLAAQTKALSLRQSIFPLLWNSSGATGSEYSVMEETAGRSQGLLRNASFLSNVSSPSSVKRSRNDSGTVPATAVRAFDLSAQFSKNGTRPLACQKCFVSDFPELVPNDAVCRTASDNDTVDLAMLILTTHKAVDRRQAIRETWASFTQRNTARLRHLFLLGRSPDEKDMRSVQEEQAKHGDIVVHDYLDTYGNLTLKTLSGFHWLVKYCPKARFFLKVDDDMWINVPSLLDVLHREEAQLQTAVGGSCHKLADPIRNSHSKWYASLKSYPQPHYAGYCSGTAYVGSLDVARSVLSVSPDVPFFHLEDVYVAFCIKRLGGKFLLKALPGFYHGHGHPCVLRAPETVSVHEVSAQRLWEIWSASCK